ncbi:hypothetical protein ACG97_05825 [Vogesella sp. EB]|uniref:hypothetical protein n=1 Tax=Vogesella sp. EB TaxID=1526735 RepID=UPI00064D2DE3|nr:hypothetical protein [Vogesella sp. EB]KMJ53767.1 hypothetical protein ACG97_05825 [Vogesella sp. EB]
MKNITKIIPIHPVVAELLAGQSRQIEALQYECGCLRVSADALEERVDLTEQQLAAADARIRELEAALVLANLPAGSRDNVIQMVREAA